MFSFLYRVFYDRTLFDSYVGKGRGYGIKLLCVLTCFATLCIVIHVSCSFFSVPSRLTDDFLTQVSEIIVRNGRISSPENVKFIYVPENRSSFFVFDTTGQAVDLNGLPSSGIYITKEDILAVSNRETRTIKIFKIINENEFIINKDDIRKIADEISYIAKIVFPPLLFILCFPGSFFVYLFMSFLSFVFSFLMGMTVKTPLSGIERMRLAVLSVTPVCVINGMSLILTAKFPSAILSSTVLMVFLYCFLKDGQNRASVSE